MAALTLSAEELASRRLHPTTLAAGVGAMREHGWLAITNAVPVAQCEAVRARMAADTPTVLGLAQKLHGRGPHVCTHGNLQQDPPFALKECCSEELLANPWAVQIARACAGGRTLLPSYTGNTNLPGSRTQPVHRDSRHAAEPLTTFVVNVCPCDVSLRNGAIELWPGTHAEAEVEAAERAAAPADGSKDSWGGEFPPEHWDRRRQRVPPVRLESRAGGLLLRDMKLWHRARPNRSLAPRFMLAVVLRAAGDDGDKSRVVFERGCEAAVAAASASVELEGTFVSRDEVPYIKQLTDGVPDRSGLFDDTGPLGLEEEDDGARRWAEWWWKQGGRQGIPRVKHKAGL